MAHGKESSQVAYLLIRFSEKFNDDSEKTVANKEETDDAAMGPVAVFVPGSVSIRPEEQEKYQAFQCCFIEL